MARSRYRAIKKYIEVLKPRESILLTFIGFCVVIIASQGQVTWDRLMLAVITILFASAGANGLTNYLDRDIDARMKRTRGRVLPSKRIYPPEKVLPLTVGLVNIGLILAFLLHPYCFFAGLAGTLAAILWRKRWTCVFPQGIIASWAPVLMGWFAVDPGFNWQLLLLCVLIAIWLPLHLWSVMIANREDYLGAGIDYFPMSREPKKVIKLLLGLSIILYATSIGIYFIAGFSWLYLVLANAMGIVLLYTSTRLVLSNSSKDSWKLYKMSAFPYLGFIFLAMCIDIWLPY